MTRLKAHNNLINNKNGSPTVRLRTTGLTLLTLMLAACGSDDSSDSGASGGGSSTPAVTAKDIVISPSLGLVTQGVVKVSKLDGTAITSGITGVDGTVKLNIPAGIDAVIVEVTGSDATRYFDEAVPGALQPFPSTYRMRAMTLVSTDKQPVAVTPLTEIAYQYAQTKLGVINRFTLLQANDFVEGYFSIDNILTPPSPMDDVSDFATLKIDTTRSRAATNYALTLAAMSRVAATRTSADNSPALRLMKEMAEDLADGALNNAAATTYPSNNLPNALKLALNAYFTTLAANNVTLPVELKSHMELYQFRINNIFNNTNPETPPTGGGGSGNPSPSIIRITPNITGEALAPFKGSYSGKDIDGFNCSFTVEDNGTLTIVVNGAQVSKAVLDGGPEDLLRQSFDSAGKLLSNLFMAKTSATSTLATFLGTVENNTVRMAGEFDEDAGKVKYACSVSTETAK